MKRLKAAIYARVSTDDQSVENQVQELERIAEFKGWRVTHVLKDEGVSGTKAMEARKGSAELQKLIASRKVDVIMVWAIDRLGRRVKDLVLFLDDLNHCGVELYIRNPEIDTTSPFGKAFYHIIASLAELEREQIVQRVKAGIQRRKKAGLRIGRKPVWDNIIEEAIGLKALGVSNREIARRLKVSPPTVAKALATLQNTPETAFA